MSSWTQPYFDNLYLKRWALGLPNADVRRNAAFIVEKLEAAPGRALIDVGCGQGRYAIAFAEQGLRVTGFDASEVLLVEAARLGNLAGVVVDWRQGDMRSLPFRHEFDHAVLMDAFGFFDTEQDDLRVLREIAMALKPGGTCVVVMVNGQRLIEHFRLAGHEERPGVTITIERVFDPASRVLTEYLSFHEEGRVLTGERRQRLYLPEQIQEAAKLAGFQVEGFFGDLKEATFGAAVSEKMVLQMRRGR